MADLLKKRFTAGMVSEMSMHLANNSFNQKIADAKAALKSAADDFYRDYYGDVMIEEMNNLPEGWLNKSENFYVKVCSPLDMEKSAPITLVTYAKRSYKSDVYELRNASAESLGMPMSKGFRMPAADLYEYRPYAFNHPLIVAYMKAHEEEALARKAKDDFRLEMASIIRLSGNFHQLYHAWPEVRELLREFEPKAPVSKPMLPSTDFSTYNTMLGIPKEKTIVATA